MATKITIIIEMDDDHQVGLDKTMTLPCLVYYPSYWTGTPQTACPPTYNDGDTAGGAGEPIDFNPTSWPWGC